MRRDVANERTIVSRNCTFIDERGRLVQKDLVIKGSDVYGVPSQMQDSNQYFLERMRRSKDDRKKRSRSRDKNKLSRANSRDSESGSCNEGSSYASSSFYENGSRAQTGGYSSTGYQGNSNALR